MSLDPKIVVESEFGFRRLNPPPSAEALRQFYDEAYYDASDESRAPDLRRLAGDDDAAADAERRWRTETIYTDVAALLGSQGLAGGRLLDVGCGTGEFVAYLGARPGFVPVGVEPAPAAVATAQARGLDVRRGTIYDVAEVFDEPFDAITMFNVLEHVLDPVDVVRRARAALRDGGLLMLQVPNDFSVLQDAARRDLGADEWWIAIPDHINYFDFDSLERLLVAQGFQPVDRYATFPMEMFLIAGLDYVTDPSVGGDAHRRRCEFELSLDPELRRRLYRQFAAAGLGRNAIVIARAGADER